MEYALIAILVVAVLAVVYFVAIKKPAPELTEGAKAKELPKKEEPPREGPSLTDKLEARRAEMAKPAGTEAPKEPPKEAAKEPPSEAPKPGVTTEEPEKTAEPAKAEGPIVPTPSPVQARASIVPGSHVEGLRKGLAKSRAKEGFFGRLAGIVSGRKEIDPSLVQEIEEVLLTSDVGVKGTEEILARIRQGLERSELSDPSRVWDALRSEAKRILSVGGGGIVISARPTVVMMVGVNGAGKTTTIGKIATKLHAEGRKVVLAAGDTFRAAAVQQLEVWGKRVGCEVVKGKDGADPAGVAFDAVTKAKANAADVVLVDTAGRLHTKSNLMDELKKIARSLTKAIEGAPHETLLVIDATNGQNAMAQAKQFKEALPLTGIVLTKLDGTAKGGVILGICDELAVPVRYVGLGERPDDLHEFHADEYVEALFGREGSGAPVVN